MLYYSVPEKRWFFEQENTGRIFVCVGRKGRKKTIKVEFVAKKSFTLKSGTKNVEVEKKPSELTPLGEILDKKTLSVRFIFSEKTFPPVYAPFPHFEMSDGKCGAIRTVFPAPLRCSNI